MVKMVKMVENCNTHLTDRERNIIAQRAAGSYAIVPQLQKIIIDHRKSKSIKDMPFLEFGRLVMKKSWDRDEYERLQRAVLNIIPHPFGIPFHLRG
jgi:hypothetical protein